MKRFLVDFLAIGSAGFAGAVLRWLIGTAMNRLPPVPWGTLIINVAGSFVLGWFMTVVRERVQVSETVTLAVAVGFVGSFTTFSSLMYETDAKVQDGSHWLGFGYLAGSLILGLVAVRVGVLVGHPR
jgi:CrcB protein